MLTLTRALGGHGRITYAGSRWHSGAPGARPVAGGAPRALPVPAAVSGPAFKGMDPSDPLTYVRPWSPQPGMIAYLNFDGAQLQGRTPTQLRRGSQARHRKLRMGG